MLKKSCSSFEALLELLFKDQVRSRPRDSEASMVIMAVVIKEELGSLQPMLPHSGAIVHVYIVLFYFFGL